MNNKTKFYSDLQSNITYTHTLLHNQADITIKQIYIPTYQCKAALYYISGRTDTKATNEIIHSLTSIDSLDEYQYPFTLWLKAKTSMLQIETISTFEDFLHYLFDGKSILLLDELGEGIVLETGHAKIRSFQESTTEKVVRGPKIAFIESVQENIGLVRQLSNDPNLVIRQSESGSHGKNTVAMLYVEGTAKKSLVFEVEDRIKKIKNLDLLDSGILEQEIEDSRYSPFPQIQNTDRPDRVIAALNQGRVVIFVDGSPFALIAPTTIYMLLQSPDDYYERWIAASLIRLLRYASIFITMFLSAIYISLVSFNPGLLPTDLAITIAGTRKNIPFPPFIEALIMEITIELLREAGIRLPTPVGQTIGLVGGVIIGQAAVEAHIVSSIMVIIVSLTTITSFTVPQYGFGLAFRVLRFGAMLSAAAFGIFGTTLYFIMIMIHLTKLESFNESYFSPSVAYTKRKWRDGLLRLPRKEPKPK